MKIKNRKISFLALALAGVVSLASLEGVYAGGKDKGSASASKKEVSDKTARTKDDVSTNRKELGIKYIKSEDKDDVAEKAKDKDGQKAKDAEKPGPETQKITLVKKVGETVTLKTPENKTITVDSKGGKVIAEDSASVVAVLEVLSREKGFDGIFSDFKIPTSTMAGNVKLVTELRERGFTVDGDGNWNGRAYGDEIEKIVIKFPVGPMNKGIDFRVVIVGVPVEAARRMPEIIISEHFNERKDDIVFVIKFVEPMYNVWKDARFGGVDNPNRHMLHKKTKFGIILINEVAKAIMMDATAGFKVWKNLTQQAQERPSKITFILPEEAAGAFENKHGLSSGLPFSAGFRAYSVTPKFMDDFTGGQNVPAGVVISLAYDDPIAYGKMQKKIIT